MTVSASGPAGPARPAPGTVPDAVAEPVERVGWGWTAALSLANGAVWAGWFGPIQILLALQAAELAPGHKASALAWVTSLGAVVSMVAGPVFGALSDRTTSRFGRRTPWIAGGVVGGAAGLVLLSAAQSVAAMAVGWGLVQLALNAAFAALTAAVPDRVPREQRGAVGGWLGLAQNLGVLGGTALATLAGGIEAGYLACAVCTLTAALPYVLLHRDAGPAPEPRPRAGWAAVAKGLWIDPRRHPDVGWAWLTRFLVNLSNSVALLYLLYFLRDVLLYGGPDGGGAEHGVLILTAVYGAVVLVTGVAGGVWSDRAGRRKPFVRWAAAVTATAAALLAVWQTWPGAVVAAVLLGIGFGVFTSVDFALMTDVLPTAADRGKDLGLINIANSLPQVLAPAIAAPVVTHLGGYRALYGVSAALALLAAFLVRNIRGVA